MFGPLGFPEMIFIVVLALLIFGPKRLPEVGRTIGKGMAQFRKATSDLRRTIETEIALENEPRRPAPRPAAAPATQPRHAQLQLPGASLPASASAPATVEATVEPSAAIEPAADVPAVEGDPGESRRS
jgi:TatA/E family protein of Tat protein translocase